MLTITQLSKSYGSKIVLDSLDFTFSGGQVYGIVGANGAGKTTFFRCLAGLEGFNGDVQWQSEVAKPDIGYVPAEPFFLPKITGQEYLRLMLEARKKSLGDLINYDVFDLPLQDYVSSYSTGMKKKLVILAALLQDNQVYILDEVYNGLDFQSSLVLTDIIRRLREQGKLVIIASHIFSLMEETGDHMLYLKSGHLEMTASREDFPTLKAHLSKDLAGNNLDTLFQHISGK